MSLSDDKALFGECKWTSRPIDTDVLVTLIERSSLFQYEHCFLYLFSKSGFTKRVEDYVLDDEAIRLVEFEKM